MTFKIFHSQLLLILVLFCPVTLGLNEKSLFVVWNVGQGLWTTVVFEGHCIHIDMGGEVYPKPVDTICKDKPNQIFLTHVDFDHINFIRRFSFTHRDICINFPRVLPSPLRRIPKCSSRPKWIQTIHFGPENHDRNQSSLVYQIGNLVLVPGDSPKKEEKKWLHKIQGSVKILVAGHHGSNTSTHKALLQKSQVKMAIISARKKRYGHPHFQVLKRLKKQRVSPLSSETLGHIFIEFSKIDRRD